jgi:hypothetical protein
MNAQRSAARMVEADAATHSVNAMSRAESGKAGELFRSTEIRSAASK